MARVLDGPFNRFFSLLCISTWNTSFVFNISLEFCIGVSDSTLDIGCTGDSCQKQFIQSTFIYLFFKKSILTFRLHILFCFSSSLPNPPCKANILPAFSAKKIIIKCGTCERNPFLVRWSSFEVFVFLTMKQTGSFFSRLKRTRPLFFLLTKT